MQDTLKMSDKTQLSKLKFTAVVNGLISGYTPDPEDPDPAPWPWRHVINKAFERMAGSYLNKWTFAALNPQPLPPKAHFAIALAHEVIERAAMMQEIAGGLNGDSEERGIIIVSGYINKFVDDICPERPKIKWPKKRWPFPWPPEPEPDPRWSGVELAVIGTIFQNEARLAGHEGIQRALNEAGEKLLETGLSRM